MKMFMMIFLILLYGWTGFSEMECADVCVSQQRISIYGLFDQVSKTFHIDQKKGLNKTYVGIVKKGFLTVQDQALKQAGKSGAIWEIIDNVHTTNEEELLLKHAKYNCYLDNTEDAVRSYKEVLAQNPSNILALIGLAKAYLARNDPNSALTLLLKAEMIQPNNYYIILYLRTTLNIIQLYNRTNGFSDYEAFEEQFWNWVNSMLSSITQLIPKHSKNVKRPLILSELRNLQTFNRTKHIKLAEFFGARKYAHWKYFLPMRLVKLLAPYYAHLYDKYSSRSKHQNNFYVAVKLTSFAYFHNSAAPGFDFTENARIQVRTHNNHNRFEIIGDPIGELLNHLLAIKLSSFINSTLIPTYVFPIQYIQRGNIQPHIDQKDNEISVSYQLRLDGCRERWPLFFIDPNISTSAGQRSPSKIDISFEEYSSAISVVMDNNDGVIYKGRELVHFRNPKDMIAEPECKLLQIIFAWRTTNELHCVGE